MNFLNRNSRRVLLDQKTNLRAGQLLQQLSRRRIKRIKSHGGCTCSWQADLVGGQGKMWRSPECLQEHVAFFSSGQLRIHRGGESGRENTISHLKKTYSSLVSMANDWPGPMGLLGFSRQRCHSPVTSSAPVCAVGQLVALYIQGLGGIIPDWNIQLLQVPLNSFPMLLPQNCPLGLFSANPVLIPASEAIRTDIFSTDSSLLRFYENWMRKSILKVI